MLEFVLEIDTEVAADSAQVHGIQTTEHEHWYKHESEHLRCAANSEAEEEHHDEHAHEHHRDEHDDTGDSTDSDTTVGRSALEVAAGASESVAVNALAPSALVDV